MLINDEAFKGLRFKRGTPVNTEYGEGVIVGVEFPGERLMRWIVEITKPNKSHSLIAEGKPMAFFNKEVLAIKPEVKGE